MTTLSTDVKSDHVAMIAAGAIAGAIALQAAASLRSLEIPSARSDSSRTLARYGEATTYLARWHMQGILPSSPAAMDITAMAEAIFRYSEIFGSVEVLRHLAVVSSLMVGGEK
jgi:hypothetical protein